MTGRWLVRRLLRLVLLLFGVSVLCFALVALSPTDPAVYVLRRGNLAVTPEALAEVRAELGLDLPLALPIFSVTPQPGISGLLLPSLALSLPLCAGLVRVFRASLLEEMSRDYARYAAAMGMPRGRILLHLALPNALPPLVTLFAQSVGMLIASGAVVEQVFSLRGVGSYLLAAITAADTNAVSACMLVIAALYLICEMLGELLLHALCPWRDEGGADI